MPKPSFWKDAKPVRLINTGEEFPSIQVAAQKYNVRADSIGECCNGKKQRAGRMPYTREWLQWEFVNPEDKVIKEDK